MFALVMFEKMKIPNRFKQVHGAGKAYVLPLNMTTPPG